MESLLDITLLSCYHIHMERLLSIESSRNTHQAGFTMKNRLEELRKARGINQEELASALEVSRQTISQIERGDYSPSVTLALKLATPEEIETIKKYAFQVNDLLKSFMKEIGIDLVDFKLEFGRLTDGTIVLADEISPDTCRLWDEKTHEKLDKDRFRRDLGGVEDAYHEVMRRLMGE